MASFFLLVVFVWLFFFSAWASGRTHIYLLPKDILFADYIYKKEEGPIRCEMVYIKTWKKGVRLGLRCLFLEEQGLLPKYIL